MCSAVFGMLLGSAGGVRCGAAGSRWCGRGAHRARAWEPCGENAGLQGCWKVCRTGGLRWLATRAARGRRRGERILKHRKHKLTDFALFYAHHACPFPSSYLQGSGPQCVQLEWTCWGPSVSRRCRVAVCRTRRRWSLCWAARAVREHRKRSLRWGRRIPHWSQTCVTARGRGGSEK